MEDAVLRYYEAEMRYLREAGREFARAHPDRARMLNLDRVGDRDPYVERLYEGFAFLTGRIAQKLDDELPELTEGLVSLLWPHYLRMIPSLSILEIMAASETLQQSERIEAGMEVRSSTIEPAGISCVYRTTQPVILHPLRIEEAAPFVREDGRNVIRMRFAIERSARMASIDLSRLRLYLNADLPVAFAMHLALTRKASRVRWRVPGLDDGAATLLDGVRFDMAGFAPEDRLWPKADAAFSGYQLLLEYFTFREKFLFVDLVGLDLARLPERAGGFELEVELSEAYPADLQFDADNIRLFCTPIINLFELDAEPIHVNHHDTEYRVVPSVHQGENVETYSVDAVESFDHRSAVRHAYAPFASFRHRGGMLRHEAPERYYHSRVRQGVRGLFDTWLILGGHAWDEAEDLVEETLSLRVTGCNGMLPRRALRDSTIGTLVTSAPYIRSARNLTAPTPPVYPPVNDRFQWRVLSHLAPNFVSLMDAEVLRGTLALYDWTDDPLNRRRLAGIQQVREELLEEVREGGLERGVGIEVTLDSNAFAGEGDIYLFGELLHRFFALYADINLFTRLTIVSWPSGRRMEWPRSHAERSGL